MPQSSTRPPQEDPTPETTLTAASRWGELGANWRILLAATVGAAFGVHTLPFYTAGIFIQALNKAEGWSPAALALGPTIMVGTLALASPVLGYLFDRFGERRFIVPGLLAQALALGLLSRAESLATFWGLMGAMALFGAGCTAPAYVRIINRHFDLNKGAALAIMITGSALLSALAPPALQDVITVHGWRTAYLTLGLVVLAATPVIGLALRGAATAQRTVRPASGGAADDFRYGRVLRDPTFLVLAGAVTLIALACPGLLIHFPAMMTRAGLTAEQAAWLVSLVGLTQIAARLSTGVLVDRLFAPRVATAVMTASTGGFLVFWWGGPEWAVTGAIAVGLAYGAEADLVGYFAGRYFPKRHFGRVFGLFYAAFLLGTAASPSLYGYLFARQGTYDGAPLIGAALLGVTCVLFLALPRFPALASAPQEDAGRNAQRHHKHECGSSMIENNVRY